MIEEIIVQSKFNSNLTGQIFVLQEHETFKKHYIFWAIYSYHICFFVGNSFEYTNLLQIDFPQAPGVDDLTQRFIPVAETKSFSAV